MVGPYIRMAKETEKENAPDSEDRRTRRKTLD